MNRLNLYKVDNTDKSVAAYSNKAADVWQMCVGWWLVLDAIILLIKVLFLRVVFTWIKHTMYSIDRI